MTQEQVWKQFICRACGLIYDEKLGDPDSDIAPGTRFADIPEDWVCPLCGVVKADAGEVHFQVRGNALRQGQEPARAAPKGPAASAATRHAWVLQTAPCA